MMIPPGASLRSAKCADVQERSPRHFLGGWYRDDRGREWLCVQRHLKACDDGIWCESRDGWMTAANPATFLRWAWEPISLFDDQSGSAGTDATQVDGQVPGRPE